MMQTIDSERRRRSGPGLHEAAATTAKLWPAAAILLLLAGCGQGDSAAPPQPPPAVGVRPAEYKGVSWAYEFVGRIKAINIVELRARVEGFLDKVAFIEGQDVKAGDLLYQIEKDQYQARVDQAKANLASAQAQAVDADLQYNRALQLVKNGNIPQATVDKNKATLESAKATVLQTQAALTQAQINLSYTDILAPVDGRIGRTAYTLGNLVNANSGVLATIVSQDPIYVQFPVSQRQLEEIRKARQQPDGKLAKIEILVRMANGTDYPHVGVWNFTDPQVDQTTDTLMVRATVPNPERQLVDGQFVTAVFKERKEQPHLVVPQSAVQIDQAGSYVLVVDGTGKVELRRIKTGANQDTDVIVESGLKEGEKVIVDGVQKVRPGQTVQSTLMPDASGA